MQILRASTASQEILLGPFVDETDGVTPENALTIANTDIQLFKAGATSLASKNSGGGTYITSSNGLYYAVLDATDTNTAGTLVVSVDVAGALPVRHEFVVLGANVYDALLGSDYLWVDAVALNGSTASAADLQDFADAGYDPATNKVEGVKLVDTTTTNTDMRGTDGANTTTPPTANAIADQVWDELQSAHVTAGSFGEIATEIASILVDTGTTLDGKLNTIDTNVDAILVDTGTTIPAQISGLNDPTAAAIADAVWDEAIAGHAGAGSTGEALSNASAPTAAAIADAVWTEAIADHSGTVGSTAEALDAAGGGVTAAAIADAVWDEVLSGHLTAGTTGAALNSAGSGADAATIADAVLDEALSGHTTAGTLGKALADIETDVAAILVDTGTTLPASLTAIETDTQDLQTQIGTAGAGLTAIPAVGLTAAAVDAIWDEPTAGHVTASTFAASISDILADTNELQTDDVPGLILALNDLDSTAVQTAAAAALTAYDPPTKAELDSGLAGLNDPTAAAIADAVWDELQSGHVTAGSFGEIASEIASILTDTGTTLPASIAALNDIDVASILAGSITEPANGDEAFPMTVEEALAWMVAWVVNKKTLNRSTGAGVLRNQADSGNLLTWTDSDDGTTYTAGVKS